MELALVGLVLLALVFMGASQEVDNAALVAREEPGGCSGWLFLGFLACLVAAALLATAALQ